MYAVLLRICDVGLPGGAASSSLASGLVGLTDAIEIRASGPRILVVDRHELQEGGLPLLLEVAGDRSPHQRHVDATGDQILDHLPGIVLGMKVRVEHELITDDIVADDAAASQRLVRGRVDLDPDLDALEDRVVQGADALRQAVLAIRESSRSVVRACPQTGRILVMRPDVQRRVCHRLTRPLCGTGVVTLCRALWPPVGDLFSSLRSRSRRDFVGCPDAQSCGRAGSGLPEGAPPRRDQAKERPCFFILYTPPFTR